MDGKKVWLNKVIIWCWREVFQYDFVVCMQWLIYFDFFKVNYQLVIIINGEKSFDFFYIDVDVGLIIEVDVSEIYDFDGDELIFNWF